MLLTQTLEVGFQRVVLLHGCVVEALRGFLLEGDLSVVVHASFLLAFLLDVDACSSQLPTLLKRSQTSTDDTRQTVRMLL